MKSTHKLSGAFIVSLPSALYFALFFVVISCQSPKPVEEKKRRPVRLVTVDPGHFHAALVQKSMYDDVDSVVHVYAPPGNDVDLHLNRIKNFNTREEDPTTWNEEVYTGQDFFEKMLGDSAGNVVVLSGNNRKKTEYISRSLDAGLNVLADKPMVINSAGFEMLKTAFETAEKKDLLLYDIMTERFEITTILQKELSMIRDVFGTIETGSPDKPAVTKESVHHFYKYVSGSVLTRPAWFMDVTQAGEGIVDVTTHLVDLVQWECFPEQVLNYNDIEIVSAKRWATKMTRSEFAAITKVNEFPDYLKPYVVNDSVLNIYCNGEINYKIKGVHAKVSVTWAYRSPGDGGDTHYSIMRGSKADLVIRQGADQQFKPTLYIEPKSKDANFEQVLMEKMKEVEAKYPGVTLKKNAKGWEVDIPAKYKEGHEAHFTRVTEKFLEYLKNKNMPAWEVPNMLTKYYTTTKALEVATATK
jgi:predicted dehydrogenase